MTRLRPLRPDDMSADALALYNAILTGPRKGAGLTDDNGSLRGPFDPLLRTPEIGDALQQLGATIRFAGSLPDALRELAIVATAGYWGCRFELAAHGTLAERAGVSAETVAAIGEGREPELPDGSDQRLVYDATTELLNTKRLGDETYEALAGRLGEPTVVEMVIVVGYYSLLAMVLEGFEITH